VGQAVGQGATQSARLGTEPAARAEATALESAKPAGLGPTPGSLSAARQTPNQTFGLNAVNETTAASPQAPLAINREVNLEFTLEPNAAVQSEVDALRRIGANNREASPRADLRQSYQRANLLEVDEMLGTKAGSTGLQGLSEVGPISGGHSIRDVNPGFPVEGRTMNCANCAIATDTSLSGRPTSALPGSATTADELAAVFGKNSVNWLERNSSEAISQTMQNWGSGSRAIVFGYRNPEELGHFFNVINQRRVIRFLDGQVGGPANLNNGFTRMFVLRTDK
jgi:hypothetical protein